ncbi:hypothetical protein F0562_035643 [Nyssa sinensis]|uniref:Uncharacterized protein n=1 Tax=Nyssa sinensis TaxID=561372 RepID=A0A5J5ADP3_9ASTE|nr:hypothetical protein F0562_035643 [Nyssa sinensis]
MARFNCFTALVGRKKKDKGGKRSLNADDYYKGLKTLRVRIECPMKSSEVNELKSSSFTVPVPFDIPENSRCKVKVMNYGSPIKGKPVDVAYEGEDEHDENMSMKQDYSDIDLQAHEENEENDQSINKKMNFYNSFDAKINDQFENKTEKDAEEGVEMIQSGHVSDPGIRKAEFWPSPKLKRSCSNLETRDVIQKLPCSESFEEMQRLAEGLREEVLLGNPGSPRSVATHCSADKVILKKHSSSQVLPSQSRRLWWKLFLWSHRNLRALWTAKPQTLPIKPAFNQQGGYSSDTLEPNRFLELGKLESPGSFTGESLNRGSNNNNKSWDGFHAGVSGLWPQNQWVAFPPESSFTRVDEWVKELATQPSLLINDDDTNSGGIISPPSPDTGRSLARSISRPPTKNLPEEIVHANTVIQSLNSSSTVAHISGIGLKVIPAISCFSSLRSVNLSGNSIVHIAPGSLPKALHTLNLSKNKIHAIEGLRELTRLRILDLSYNRISRIGHGLSNCTLIKELYIAGNKISDVEGLHRFSKLTVLDLSFNKMTTAKGLGQLVANYNSLLALNLLGNPIQSNISDDQLRKAVCGLLPKLAYLNKQPINPQKAREFATEGIAKAALGNSGWSSHRKTAKRVTKTGSFPSSGHRSSAGVEIKRHQISNSIRFRFWLAYLWWVEF